MIRVNLIRNRVSETTSMTEVGGSDSSGEMRSALIKIAFILLFTIGLMMWESQNIRTLESQKAAVGAQVQELEQKATEMNASVEGIKDIAKQAEELKDKLKVLKLLSRLRLREVKTLDFMQSSIPEKVWLKSINFESQKTAMEKGHFQFIGSSVATDDLTEFVKKLEDSAYMEEVIVIKNQEVAGPGKTGNIRDYTFTAEVEAKN
jgi:Tfp pilus assembly protein PilN